VSAGGAPDPAFESAFSARCDIRAARDRNDAVAGSDVVITATPGRGPLFDAAAVRPGTHLTCVGADTAGKRELPEHLLARARIFVDDHEQARSIGECQWAPALPRIEIGDVLAGVVTVDRAAHDITVFDMTGLALQDLTVARVVYRQAVENGAGHRVPWPW
jgi:ornithine cyclodeaminase